jgi:hypothetical protein
MSAPTLAEDDFSDLDAIISEAEERRASAHALTIKQKRLSRGSLSEEDRIVLLAEIRLLEDAYIWHTTAAVALFDTQACANCGHTHRFFQGWMTAQQHRRDPNCRRLIRGKPVEPLPERIEEHQHGFVEFCGDCAESYLLVCRITDTLFPRAVNGPPSQHSPQSPS